VVRGRICKGEKESFMRTLPPSMKHSLSKNLYNIPRRNRAFSSIGSTVPANSYARHAHRKMTRNQDPVLVQTAVETAAPGVAGQKWQSSLASQLHINGHTPHRPSPTSSALKDRAMIMGMSNNCYLCAYFLYRHHVISGSSE